LEGRETPTLAKSRDEISRILVKEKLDKQEQDRNSAIQIDFNEQFVGPVQNSAWMPANQLNAPPTTGGDSKLSPVKSEMPK
jgi:hypothetical protein